MKKNKDKQLQQLNARIPKSLHQDFTIYCLKKGVSKEVMIKQIVEGLLNGELMKRNKK